MAQAQALPSSSMTTGQPGWDEQIVPTLRQRLVNESAELSSRLSATSFPDDDTPYPSGPSAPSTSFLAQRQRTTSTPLGTSAPAPSRIPQPSAYRAAHAQLTAGSGTKRNGGGHSRSNPPVRPGPGSRQNSTGSASSHGHSSRVQARVSPDKRPIALSREDSSGPSQRDRYLQPGPTERGVLQNRDSFDLSSSNLPDVSIRNELPPFRMDPAEAMRIAQRGHVPDDGDSGYGGGTASGSDEDGFVDRNREGYRSRGEEGLMDDSPGRRKRSESMSPVAGFPSGSGRNAAGFAGLGKGTPSSRKGVGVGKSPSTGGAKRNATNPTPKSALSSSTTARSASMNLLSHSTSTSTSAPSSRINGVAAHLVPPESSFTPPKNANWDDVVIPAVAKKMALNSSTSSAHRGEEAEHDDELAVEWDTEGRPIKWAKASGSKLRAAPEDQAVEGKGKGSSFSPTFDPSPDNPMNPATGSYPLYPAPPLGQSQAHNVNYNTTTRQYGFGPGLGPDIPPSPAPFAHYAVGGKENLSPRDAAMLQHQQSQASFRSASRQPSHHTLRQQASYQSMTSRGRGESTPLGAAQNQRAADGGEQGWQEYPTPPRSPARAQKGGRDAATGPGAGKGNGKGKGKGKEGDHGKGCGCVIM